MIGGLDLEERGEVNTRHQEGTENEEELTLKLTGVTEMGKDRKEGNMASWRNTELWCQGKKLHRNLLPM
ncbi:hypothetical protein N7537_000598 [Penicillium hordei]|uniref:Uncharacterized protein n=1 Tax=Penicillium hordei TaxID=40994 RepID=A0AAD6EE12_9EURO|nr:uncharacterized protein N7537_000598 [Penicillium hordei]KAJ5615484.1 hypothetical protein N7537_000598 [Penicillium hordei]